MPKLHAITFKDKETFRMQKIILFGAPIAVDTTIIGQPTSESSELVFEAAPGTGFLKVTIRQAKTNPGSSWQPNEIEIDLEGVRSLRDACNRFLDRFHDEAGGG